MVQDVGNQRDGDGVAEFYRDMAGLAVGCQAAASPAYVWVRYPAAHYPRLWTADKRLDHQVNNQGAESMENLS